MAPRSIWVTILLVTLTGLVKAQWHFIQLAMVGAMGLTGMWIMHKLAQDYNKITNPRPPATLAKLFFRRSTSDIALAQEWSSSSSNMEGLDFEEVLKEDPMGCAQRMVCQMAATPQHTLTEGERNILKMLRAKDNSWRRPSAAWKVFRVAAELGTKSSDQSCIEKYPTCPHSRSEISRLIQL